MTTLSCSARGASTHCPTSYSIYQPIDELSVYGMTNRIVTEQGWGWAIDELLRIRRLEDDWDGQGTVAPPPPLVDGAIRLAQSLKLIGWPPPDFVHACTNPTVYFEWHTPVGPIEIEVLSPNEAECRLVRNGSIETIFICL